MNKVIIPQLTEVQVEEWKRVYGRVFCVELEDGEERHACYLRRPSIETLSTVVSLSKQDEIAGSRKMIEDCFLGGSTQWQGDGILFGKLVEAFSGVTGQIQASLKKL